MLDSVEGAGIEEPSMGVRPGFVACGLWPVRPWVRPGFGP